MEIKWIIFWIFLGVGILLNVIGFIGEKVLKKKLEKKAEEMKNN